MKLIDKWLLLSLSIISSAAQSAIINFEDIPDNIISTNIQSGGFDFVGNGYLVTGTDGNGGGCGPTCASNGTRTLLAAGPVFATADQVSVTRVGGGTFQLLGLDAAEFRGATPIFNALRIDYIGVLGGATVTSGTLLLDQIVDGPGGLPDFQTFVLPGVVVDTFTFSGAGRGLNNGFSLDNLIVETVSPNNVPEPGTLTLSALGAIGFGLIRHRRQRPAQT